MQNYGMQLLEGNCHAVPGRCRLSRLCVYAARRRVCHLCSFVEGVGIYLYNNHYYSKQDTVVVPLFGCAGASQRRKYAAGGPLSCIQFRR